MVISILLSLNLLFEYAPKAITYRVYNFYISTILKKSLKVCVYLRRTNTKSVQKQFTRSTSTLHGLQEQELVLNLPGTASNLAEF